MEKVDKDVAAMLKSLKKYDQLVESVAPVLGMKTLSGQKMEENYFHNPNLPADKQLPAPPEEIDMEEMSTCEDDMMEDDMEEGNEFSGELAKAKSQHQDEFTVGGKRYPVNEDDTVPESRLYHALVKFLKAGQSGKIGHVDWHRDYDTEVKKAIQLLYQGDIKQAVDYMRSTDWTSYGNTECPDELAYGWMRRNLGKDFYSMLDAVDKSHGIKNPSDEDDDELVREDDMEENIFRNPNLPADKQLPDPPKEIDIKEQADPDVLAWMNRFAKLGNMKGYGR